LLRGGHSTGAFHKAANSAFMFDVCHAASV
jgi:hypothetical protein